MLFRSLSERIHRNGATLLTSNDTLIEPLSSYVADVENLRKTITSLTRGDASIGLLPVSDPQSTAILKSLEENTTALLPVAKFIHENAASIVAARRDIQALSASSEAGIKEAAGFRHEMQAKVDRASALVSLSALFVLGALASFALLAMVKSRGIKMDAWEAAYRNKKSEKELIDFMQDIAPLESGDLTVRLDQNQNAMSGITGALRASVNGALEVVHDAVSTVKRGAEGVHEVIEQQVRSAGELRDANQRQAGEIQRYAGHVGDIASAMALSADKTIAAADFVARTRSASEEGAQAAGEAQARIAQIRGTMAQVLDSVQQLGGASQEIRNLAATIQTITEHSQVLAVNASLEAARAGEAGLAFQVIAGEVNSLAEEASNALQGIAALALRMHSDSGLAIRAVESTSVDTNEVARLSDAATAKLADVEDLSRQLFDLMSEIRADAVGRGANATELQSSMKRLSELSKVFEESVAEVVSGAQRIDSSMGALKKNVAAFRTNT